MASLLAPSDDEQAAPPRTTAPAAAPDQRSSSLPAAHKMQMWASIMLTVAALAVIALLLMKG